MSDSNPDPVNSREKKQALWLTDGPTYVEVARLDLMKQDCFYIRGRFAHETHFSNFSCLEPFP